MYIKIIILVILALVFAASIFGKGLTKKYLNLIKSLVEVYGVSYS